MYPINKNIPVPPIKRTSVRKTYPFETMEVGDCLLIPGKRPAQVQPHVSKSGKDLGFTFVTRAVKIRPYRNGYVLTSTTHPQAEDGVGVWRDA